MKFVDHIASERGLVIVRLLARVLFAVLVWLYFLFLPDAALGMTGHGLFAGYLILQALLVWKRLPLQETLALALDAAGILFVLATDPATPSPTLVLFLVSLVSAGLLRGLNRFILVLIAYAALVFLLFATRYEPGRPVADTPTLFLLALVALAALYTGLLLFRAGIVARRAREATWRDPETGLVSRDALVATGGWLLPLHDRLASDLTIALVSPANRDTLGALADHLSARLRRSDIAARYEDGVLALLLPCTSLTAAEELLGNLRRDSVPFYAAVMTLSNDQHGLDGLLLGLRQHLSRAWGNSEHWLAHATAPQD